MKIKYLTFEIAQNCNMDCEFCFSFWREEKNELNTNQVKEIIELMRKRGLEAINFTGGEPLLRPDISELLKYSKGLGLTTILSTNGILLKKRIEEIADDVDFIGLPLDSSIAKDHNAIRPIKSRDAKNSKNSEMNNKNSLNHFEHFCELLDLINLKFPHIGIKINTIVTKQNKESVCDIGKIIEGKVISWKLSHFIASGYGKNFEEKYAISKEEYLEVREECIAKNKEINIIATTAHERNDCCRIISTNGDFIKPTKEGLVNLGSVFEINEKELSQGFDDKKNEFFLKKTYTGNKAIGESQ